MSFELVATVLIKNTSVTHVHVWTERTPRAHFKREDRPSALYNIFLVVPYASDPRIRDGF
jgi:hypothetical protein